MSWKAFAREVAKEIIRHKRKAAMWERLARRYYKLYKNRHKEGCATELERVLKTFSEDRKSA